MKIIIEKSLKALVFDFTASFNHLGNSTERHVIDGLISSSQ